MLIADKNRDEISNLSLIVYRNSFDDWQEEPGLPTATTGFLFDRYFHGGLQATACYSVTSDKEKSKKRTKSLFCIDT